MQDDEVGVSLKDVLIYCFLHWRTALVVVLVGAILGGGYYAYKGRAAATPEATTAAAEPEDESKLTEEEVELLESAIDGQQDNLAQLSYYLENSLAMRIDPNNEYVSRATILISAEQQTSPQVLNALVTAYATELTTSSALDAVAEELGTTPAFVRELITTENGSIDPLSSLNNGTVDSSTTVIQQESGIQNLRVVTLTITVIGSGAQEASLVRDAMLSELDATHDAVAATIAPHNAFVSSQQDYTTVDYSLLTRQTDRANAVASAQITIMNNEGQLFPEGEDAAEAEATTVAAQGGISLRSLLKGAVIGGVAAFLLYGFVLCLRYVLDPVPVMRGQVEARYALPGVGSYAFGAEALYRGNTGFDQWLRKLSGLEAAPDPAQVAEMVAANVRLYGEDAATILVSSSVVCARAAELAEALGAKLDDKAFILADKLVASADARGQLKGADAVIFVEEYGTSTYEDIDAEITLAAETGKTPLGLVMA